MPTIPPSGGRDPDSWGLPPVPARRAPTGAAPQPPPVPGQVSAATAPAAEVDAELAARTAHKRRWLGLVVIAFSQLLIVIDGTIVNVALPAMSDDLDLAAADRQWVITTYTIAFGGLLLLGGRIADYIGYRRTMVIGLIGFAVASGVGGAASNLEILLAARAAQGAFGAVLAPAALALLAITFSDPKERAKAFAVFGVVAGGGSAVGLIAGGLLTEYASWRWTMFINVPFAIVSVVGAYLLLDENRGEHPGKLDLVGTVLGSSGLVCVVYSFSEAERHGWTQSLTLFLLGLGLSLLILFVVSQRIVSNPLLPLRVLADRTRAGANIAITLASLSLIGAFFFLTFYLQSVLGFAPVKTGVAFLPVTGGIIVASAVVSNLMPKVAPRLLMGAGLVGSAVSLIVISTMTADSGYFSDLLLPLTLMGVSLGAVFVPAFNAATYGIEGRDAGVAGAAVNTAQQVGASLGVALLSSVAASRADGFLEGRSLDADTLIDAQVAGYGRASLVAGLILVGAAVLTVLLVNVRRLSAHTRLGEVPLPGPTAEPVAVPTADLLVRAAPGDPHPDLAPDSDPTYVPEDWHEPVPGAVTDTSEPLAVSTTFAVATPVPSTVPAVLLEADDVTNPQNGVASNGHASTPTAPVVAAPVQPEPATTWAAPPAPAYASVPAGAPEPSGWPAPTPASPVIGPRDGENGGTPPALRVLVRRGDGSAVTGAAVTLLDSAGRQVARADSDGRGCAEFAGAAGGEFLLVVRHEGYLPQARTVLLGGPTVEVEVVVTGSARLGGVVTTGRSRPVEGALVTLTGADGAVAASTRTDATGSYDLVDLTVEEGTLAVFAPSARPVAIPVRIAAGSRGRQDVQVRGNASVSGVAQTPEGWLIADARVSLVANGTEVAVTRTDADGRYSFADLEEGAYTVVAVGYPPSSTEVVAGAGETAAHPITLAHADEVTDNG